MIWILSDIRNEMNLPLSIYIFSKSTTAGGGGGDVPPQVLQALEARQEAILAKLEHLR